MKLTFIQYKIDEIASAIISNFIGSKEECRQEEFPLRL